MEHVKENFPARLRKARSQASLSREQLAHQLKTTTNTIYRWEAGISVPRGQAYNEIVEEFIDAQLSIAKSEDENDDEIPS